MSKFCVNCGAKLGDNSKFCTSCGTACTNTVAGSSDDVQAAPINNLTSLLKKYKIVFLILLLLAAAVIAVTLIISNSGYKATVRGVVNALEDEDGEKLLKYMATNDMIEFYGEDEITENMTDYCQGLSDELEDMVGGHLKWKYSIKDVDTMSGKDLEELQESIEDYPTKYFESNPFEITKGYEVKLDLTITGDDDDWKTNSVFVLLKINGKWLIYKWYRTSLYDGNDTILINRYL